MSETISNAAQETMDAVSINKYKEQEPGIGLWSVRIADSCMKRWPLLSDRWEYGWGVVLKGMEQIWLDTGDQKYVEYIKHNIDQFVKPNGDIRTYNLLENNLDQINAGKLLFGLYDETGDKRYSQALHLLVKQLKTQPRTSEGGFWYKKIYPYQMWLDGIYMATPFYAQYAEQFNESNGFDDAAHQILLIARKTCDPKTGLYYHAWDESKMQPWAHPQTGCSPHFWGRAMGLCAMGLVDMLDFLPDSHQAWDRIVTIFKRMIQAVLQFQDTETGLWHQILDRGGSAGNYTEASASCMLVYALAKGLRQGYLASEYLAAAQRGYAGILEHLFEIDEGGQVHLTQICAVAGLGGAQQCDGSYEYYINEPVVTNDHNGVGAFLLASAEIERLRKSAITQSAHDKL